MRKREEDDLAEVLRRVKDLQAAIWDLKQTVDQLLGSDGWEKR